MGELARQIEARLRARRGLAGEALPDDCVRPAYEGYSLVNVTASVLAHFGVSGVGTPVLAPEVVGDVLNGALKVVVLLVDAMGYLALAEQMDRDAGLGLHALAEAGRFVPLTTVFPSTTAVTLSSLHTGVPPSGHAITGYRMYLPDRGVIANMIRLSPDADDRPNRFFQSDEDARDMLGVPTVHSRLTRAGVRSYCLIQDTIAGSGLSEMLYAGATERIPFVNTSDMFVQVRNLVLSDPETPACVWAYWGALDSILHAYGTGGEAPEAEVRNLSYSLRRELLDPLQRAGRGRTVLMMTADHGQVQVEAEDVLDARDVPGLAAGMAAPPVGTGRSPYVYTKRGVASPAALGEAMDGWARVVGSEDALADGLWGPGPVRDELGERVGDVLLLMCGHRTLFYPYRKDAKPSDLVGGRHGGLHEREMLIPFFCARV